jgi:UDP-sulfoquinovose synthase
MRILVLGGDGYLGWPTSMYLAAKGHEVFAIDNYLRRTVALATNSEALIPSPNLEERAQTFKDVTGSEIGVRIGDLRDIKVMEEAISGFKPDAVIHYAEQPSAPYSMMGYDEALLTLDNNLKVTFNLVWSVINHRPQCHIIKLGTMGEYGTPEIDIEEGWIEIEHKGRRGRFLFPRQAGSLYHTTKIMDTDLLWFYVRTFGLTVTDLMQGPVYGLSSDETELDPRLLPNFHYDDIFGTVINRFLIQAVAGEPLTVYGAGGQTRGYLNLRDTLQCVELAALNAPEKGTLRVFNQLTECFTVNELAERVQRAGNRMQLDVKIERIDNPRKEAEQHYYNPAHTGLSELGLKPHHMTDEVLSGMLETILPYKERINPGVIPPRVRWN